MSIYIMAFYMFLELRPVDPRRVTLRIWLVSWTKASIAMATEFGVDKW